MYKVRLACLATLFFFLYSQVASAQNSKHPWAISAGAVMIKYRAPQSLPVLEGASFQPALQLNVARHLGGAFDFKTQLNLSNNIQYPDPLVELPGNTFSSVLIDMSYLLAFKINNGVFLKQNSFIGPYILFGLGGSYVTQNPDVYLPLGGGLKFRFSDRIDLRLESIRRFSVNKDYQSISHAVSLAYNVGKEKKKVRTTNPSEEEILEKTKPLDTDEDGVLDEDDLCPEIAGPESSYGCPEEKEEEQEQEQEQEQEVNSTEREIGSNNSIESPKKEVSKPMVEKISQQKPIIEKRYPEYQREVKRPCNLSLDSKDLSIYFEHASAEITDHARQKLDELAAVLNACGSSKLVVHGHTDATGADRNNLALSVLRAHRVKYYLVYIHGIPQKRITSAGFGEKKPKATNSTDTGRERNRRVDFAIIR